MAGIASIPPKHLTARAVEWLTTAVTIYGNGHFYKVPLGIAACSKLGEPAIRTPSGWCCGVEDVRAIYLNETETVRYVHRQNYTFKNDPDKQWESSPLSMPTCTDCMVLLDKAISEATPKDGRFIRALNTKLGKSYLWVNQDKDKTPINEAILNSINDRVYKDRETARNKRRYANRRTRIEQEYFHEDYFNDD